MKHLRKVDFEPLNAKPKGCSNQWLLHHTAGAGGTENTMHPALNTPMPDPNEPLARAYPG